MPEVLRELRCPSCGAANAVTGGTDLEDVRCAGCGATLDPDRTVRYFVTMGMEVHGPLDHAQLVELFRTATFGGDAWISEEGGPWVRARDREDLLDAGVLGTPKSRGAGTASSPGGGAEARERHRRGPRRPGSVTAVVVLDVLGGVVLVAVGLMILAVSADFGGGGWGGTVGFLLLLLGGSLIGLARGLYRGSATARDLHLGLATLGVLVLLVLLVTDLRSGFVVVLLLPAVLPFVLLLGDDAREFFASRARPAREAGTRSKA